MPYHVNLYPIHKRLKPPLGEPETPQEAARLKLSVRGMNGGKAFGVCALYFIVVFITID